MIDKLMELKQAHIALQIKAGKTKTKKAREKVFDQIRASRRIFADLAYTIDFTQLDLSKCNVMSMVGGPYFVQASDKIEVREHLGATLQVCINDEWAGMIHLLDSPCGMDNLKLLTK